MTCQSCGQEGYRRIVAGFFIDRHYGVHDHKFVASTPAQQRENPHFPERPARSAARLPASRARVDAG